MEDEVLAISEMLDTLDIKFNLLLGHAINIKSIGDIYPLKIKDICPIGLTKYYTYIALLTYHSDEIAEPIDVYNFFCGFELRQAFIEIASLFLRKPVTFDSLENSFVIEDISEDNLNNRINRDNFLVFVEVVRKQNGIERPPKLVYKNDIAKQMAEKFKELRAKYNKKDDETTLVDIISAICAKHESINLINVMDLTIYQIMDSFKRLNLIDNYTLTYEALLHGAKSDDIKLKHWSEKIK